MTDKTVVLIGTLDTKGAEYDFLRERLELEGVRSLLVDVGTLEPPTSKPDISREEVAAAAGVDLPALVAARDRGQSVTAMAEAAASIVRKLYDEGRCDGVLAAGGSGNTAIATSAMRARPLGVPKLMVSTMAGGNVSAYAGAGAGDVTMMPSVTDVAGMVKRQAVALDEKRPLIAATMFAVTIPAVTAAREELERRGYEVLTFHATGTGGRAMEALIESGFVTGVLDVMTTELCDELVGGVLSAGPDRLEAAGRAGVPQVVSLGALDMVNFGPRETVPAEFEGRNLYVHNPSVTLMRTTPHECAELGRQIATKLSGAARPTALFIPLRGVSAISGEGGPFYEPEADEALFSAIRENLGPNVELHEVEAEINDAGFAIAIAEKLDEYLELNGFEPVTSGLTWVLSLVSRRHEDEWPTLGPRVRICSIFAPSPGSSNRDGRALAAGHRHVVLEPNSLA